MANIRVPDLENLSTLTDETVLYVGSPTTDNKTTLGNLKTYLNADSGNNIFIGTYHYFAYEDGIPENFLVCDGSEVPQASYPILYGKIGATYGTATNPANFVLPKAEGLFLRAKDPTGWQDPEGKNRAVGNIQSFAIENITGGVTSGSGKAWLGHNSNTAGDGTGAVQVTLSSLDDGAGYILENGTNIGTYLFWDFDASRVVSTSTETRPVNMCAILCILAK